MLTKSAPFEFKSIDDAGTFEATVAVFGNVDKGGDRIINGAFTKSLERWQQSGDPIPVIFNHDWASPHAHIGVVEHAEETDRGLWVKGRLDIADNDVARQVHRLMQRRSLKEFSFGYSVPKGGERRAKDGANELTEIELAEVGPTLKGMNPQTELHAVKSAVVEHALQSELREVKARLEKVEQTLENPRSKTEETDQEPQARSVDPLRKRSEELALEVASGGLDLRKPPPPVAQDTPEPVDEDELRAKSRDWMFEVLNQTTE
jgi:HK97 family phage prohead protease